MLRCAALCMLWSRSKWSLRRGAGQRACVVECVCRSSGCGAWCCARCLPVRQARLTAPQALHPRRPTPPPILAKACTRGCPLPSNTSPALPAAAQSSTFPCSAPQAHPGQGAGAPARLHRPRVDEERHGGAGGGRRCCGAQPAAGGAQCASGLQWRGRSLGGRRGGGAVAHVSWPLLHSTPMLTLHACPRLWPTPTGGHPALPLLLEAAHHAGAAGGAARCGACWPLGVGNEAVLARLPLGGAHRHAGHEHLCNPAAPSVQLCCGAFSLPPASHASSLCAAVLQATPTQRGWHTPPASSAA